MLDALDASFVVCLYNSYNHAGGGGVKTWAAPQGSAASEEVVAER